MGDELYIIRQDMKQKIRKMVDTCFKELIIFFMILKTCHGLVTNIYVIIATYINIDAFTNLQSWYQYIQIIPHADAI